MPVSTDTCSDILEGACARNAAMELHSRTASDELIVAKTRLLDLDRRHLYIDRPQINGKPTSPKRGHEYAAYLQLSGKWYAFRTRVANAGCSVKLNANTQVRGCAVSRPAKIEEGQRREDFRLSVASLDPVDVHFHEVHRKNPDVCPLDTKRFRGRLVDISRGGWAVRIDAQERRSFAIDELFFVSAMLPLNIGEITLLVQSRHCRSILRGEAFRIGFKFVNWNPGFTLQHLRAVGKFCRDLERHMIRRRK